MLKQFIRHKDWYKTINEHIEDRYGQDADLFADLLAATSPRKSVKANWRLARRLFKLFKSGNTNGHIPLMPAHRGNVDRAFKGEPLSGNKVRAFAQNLKGNLDAVTIDVWIMRYFGVDKKSLTDKQYNCLATRIRKRAKHHNLKPAEYQAVIWCLQRRKAGKKYKSFESIRIEQSQFEFMGV